MATSHPDRTNARGVWKLSDITKNIKTEGTFPQGGDRGIFGGGEPVAHVEYITIAATGNTTDFGDLTSARYDGPGALGSFTRALWGGGNISGLVNIIDYIHFMSTGNAADFGDLTSARIGMSPVSNEVRGVWGGGKDPGNSNVIDYVTIATTGNATDFGDLTSARGEPGARGMSPIRGLLAGGITPSNSDIIDFIDIATTGNAVDFGDLTVARRRATGDSNTTKAVFAGGITPSTQDVIDTVNIGSLGNAIDFGNLSAARGFLGAVSNDNRIVFGGGNTGSNVNTMDYVTIVSAGNATDFGDLNGGRQGLSATSNGHGGLNAFNPRPPELYSPTGRPVVHGDVVGLGDIGLFQSGGYGYVKTIDYIKISTTGNGTDFGDTATSGSHMGGAGSSTRAFVAGYSGPIADNIDYGLFATKGNYADFGNLTAARDKIGSLSNNTRACWLGGRGSTSSPENLQNVIDYTTMATIGNATDFGDLAAAKQLAQGFASNTRGVSGGGATPSEISCPARQT